MVWAGITFFLLLLISLLQIFLSTRKSSWLGLIIPGINWILAIALAMQGTDFFIGFFVLFTVLAPILLWLILYKIFRSRVNKKRSHSLNKMKIQDL
jgi:hypothetical protein